MKFFALLQPNTTFDYLPDDAKRDKILLMRQDKLGDMAVTLPYFRALKRALPKSSITILASKQNAILIKYEQSFGKIIYDKNPLKFIKSLWQVFRFHPDVVVDLQLKESATSTIYVLVSRARWRIRAQRNIKLPYNIYVDIGGDWHISEEMQKLLGTVAPLDIDSVPGEVVISEAETAFAIKYFSSGVIPDMKSRRVGLNISAGKPERMLTTNEYIEICRGIIQRGFKPIILYSPGDNGVARQISHIVKGAIIGPETATVLEVISLLPKLHILITPDTAMVHFASAMKVPVLALYTANDWNCNRWLPKSVPYRFCQSADYDTMEGIDIQQVLNKFDELVGEIREK